MRMSIILIVSIAVSILMFSCSGSSNDSVSGNVDETKYGWAVGNATDGYGTIVHTCDGGVSWVRQGDSRSVPNVPLHQIRAIDSLNAWIVGGNVNGHAVVLKTTNGGKDWFNLGASKALPDVEFNAISPLDMKTVWVAGTKGSIMVTNDGGETWNSRSDRSFASYDLSDIVAVDQNNIWICGANAESSGMILHSWNGGFDWVCESDSTIVKQKYLISMSVVDEEHAWIAGHSISLRTTNGGRVWERKCPFGEVLFDVNGVAAVDDHVVWIVSDYGNINKSIDNGENWVSQGSGFGGYFMLRVCAFNKDDAWVCGMEQRPPCTGILLHTTNGGTNWDKVNYGTNGGLWDIHFLGANN